MKFGTTVEYVKKNPETLFAAVYEGNLLKLAKCFYQWPDERGVLLSELYPAFLAAGYGAMEVDTEDLTFYPDWDGCICFLCSYIKYQIGRERVGFCQETHLLKDRERVEDVLDVEKIKEFYGQVCKRTQDDYYERWIQSLVEISAYPGWQEEEQKTVMEIFDLGDRSLKAWEITALLLVEAEKNDIHYVYEFKALEDNNFMVNGTIEEKDAQIRRTKSSSCDVCLFDYCSFEEGYYYGSLLNEMNRAEEIEDVAYVSAKISWLLGKPFMLPNTLYKSLQ